MFRESDVSGIPSLDQYVSFISDGFCPFSGLAWQKGVLRFTDYDLTQTDHEVLGETIFWLGALHTEILRQERKLANSPALNLLICENLIFDLPVGRDQDGQQALAWPHWLLKLVYTGRNIMFGKFWVGETDQTVDGRQIPIPPVHLLSVRSGVRPKDFRFVDESSPLLQELREGSDAGAFAFDWLSGVHKRVVRKTFGASMPPNLEKSTILTAVQELVSRHVHSYVLDWARATPGHQHVFSNRTSAEIAAQNGTQYANH